MLIHFLSTENQVNEFLKENKMNIKIQIKTWAGSILFELEKENNTIKDTVEEAVKKGVSLKFANLSEADLSEANLSEANLSEANLSEANLSEANLSKADLSEANLSEANLSEANLSEANLYKANLSEANLYKANLYKANLYKANLSEANLSEANLSKANLYKANLYKANLYKANLSEADLSLIKEDLFRILDLVPFEVPMLLEKMKGGKINGSVYEGECACLVGTIANIKQCDYRKIEGLVPNSDRPAERWFLNLREGLTPENSGNMKITAEWVEEWIENNKVKV